MYYRNLVSRVFCTLPSRLPAQHKISTLLELPSIKSNSLRQQHTASINRFISAQQVEEYTQLSGDLNPIHAAGEQSLVHGTFLLGIVSGVIGTQLPGPGSVVSSLEVRFLRPCQVNSDVKVEVSCQSIRKITKIEFSIQNLKTNERIAEGNAKVLFNQKISN